MNTSASALVPLFRSDQQLRILGVLFGGTGDELAVGELAVRAEVAQATASREVARLEQHGLVKTRSLGRNRLVRPNWSLPWAPELRSILLQTVGVLGRLGEVLSGLEGVDEAFVFGSWAARFEGEPGPFPNDIDVAVVGDVPLRSVRRKCHEVEQHLRVDINPVVIDADMWNASEAEPFVAHIRGSRWCRSHSMQAPMADWLAEAIATGDVERVPANMGAAGERINDARRHVHSARRIAESDTTLAIAACHDAIRKALTGHMTARGLRAPRRRHSSHHSRLRPAPIGGHDQRE